MRTRSIAVRMHQAGSGPEREDRPANSRSTKQCHQDSPAPTAATRCRGHATPRKCWAPRAARHLVHQQLRAYSPSKVPRPGALGKTVEKSARPSGPNRDAESERRLITAPSTATSARREACKTSPIAEDPTSTASKRHTFYVLFKQTEEAPWNTAQTPAVSGFDD